MNLDFTDDQKALRDLARQIFDGRADRLKEIEAGPEWFDRVLWAELAHAGVLGAGIPEGDGGIGGGLLEVCVVLEEMGRAVAPIPFLHTVATGALPLARFASRSQRERWLPAIAAGEAVFTAAIYDAAPPEIRGATLSGDVSFVPFAAECDRLVVPSAGRLFLVDPAGAPIRAQVATNGEHQAIVTLDGLDAEPLGDDDGAAAWVRDVATVALCAVGAGVCERALRLTAGYLIGREQFDRPLATFQAVQQRMADAYIDVEAMRWTMWQAAWRLSQGLEAAEEIAIAKFWAAEAGQRVLSAAQHLHGGAGVDMEYPLHRYTMWAKQVELTLGSAQPHLARLGDLIAGGAR